MIESRTRDEQADVTEALVFCQPGADGQLPTRFKLNFRSPGLGRAAVDERDAVLATGGARNVGLYYRCGREVFAGGDASKGGPHTSSVHPPGPPYN